MELSSQKRKAACLASLEVFWFGYGYHFLMGGKGENKKKLNIIGFDF
jgi:hypothetical protein